MSISPFLPLRKFRSGYAFPVSPDSPQPSAHIHSPSVWYSTLMFSPVCHTFLYHAVIHSIHKYQNLRHHFIQLRRDHLADVQPGQCIRQLVIPMDRHTALLGLLYDLLRQNSLAAGYDSGCLIRDRIPVLRPVLLSFSRHSFCFLYGLLNIHGFSRTKHIRFSVLRTLEIVTNIRIPDYRPAYSCLSAPLIGNIRCLLAVTSVSYG